MTLDAYLPGLAPALCETFPPSQPHRPTSIAAAKAVAAKAPSQAQRILEYLKRCGSRGATHLEISQATDLPINVICGRFNALRKSNLVYASGDLRINAGTSKAAIVWRAI